MLRYLSFLLIFVSTFGVNAQNGANNLISGGNVKTTPVTRELLGKASTAEIKAFLDISGSGGTNSGLWVDGRQIEIVAGVIRGTVATNGFVKWDWISNSSHSNLNASPIIVTNTASGTLTLFYKTNYSKVLSFSITPDEQLAKAGVAVGASVSTDSAEVYAYVPETYGGSYYWNTNISGWSKVGGSGTGVATYNSGSGKIDLAITSIRNTGGIQDHFIHSLSPNLQAVQNGYTFALDTLSGNSTNIPIYLFTNGVPVTGTNILHKVGFTMTGPTWTSSVNLGNMGGSNAWLTNYFNPLANFWVIGIFER